MKDIKFYLNQHGERVEINTRNKINETQLQYQQVKHNKICESQCTLVFILFSWFYNVSIIL